eukprot:14590358-Alexandrium_andersonii.AAC.1
MFLVRPAPSVFPYCAPICSDTWRPSRSHFSGVAECSQLVCGRRLYVARTGVDSLGSGAPAVFYAALLPANVDIVVAALPRSPRRGSLHHAL